MSTLASPPSAFWAPSSIGFLVVMACDCVFSAYFTLRPRPKQDRPRRAPLSIVGILLQSLACALLGILHRRPTRPIVPVPLWVEIALAGLASLLAAGSLWLCIAAVVTLGRQWTYIAAVGEDHQLVTRGPYARVRHPIYAGMTGLVIATAIVVSRWWAAPIIVALQLVGTWIRANQEDRLLREAHGQSFADYAANVPAIVPRLWRTPGVS